MVQENNETDDNLNPDAIFERRKRIIEAIRFEIDLEETAIAEAKIELAAAQDTLQEAQDALDNLEFTKNSLEDAILGISDSLTQEQQTELAAQG